MKKNKWLMLLMAGTIVAGSMSTVAASMRIRVFINSEEIHFTDGQPYADESNRTQIPVRYVSERMGANVKWDPATRRVTISNSEKEIILFLNKKEMLVNGQAKKLDTAATAKNGRTYVPLRFVSEGLGGTVDWDDIGKNVYITTGKALVPEGKKVGEGYEAASGFVVPTSTIVQTEDQGDGNWVLITESGLRIDVHAQPSGSSKVVMNFIIGGRGTGTYLEKYEEARPILEQKISKEAVDEIIKYASKAKEIGDPIEAKDFYEGAYKIHVGASEAVNIKVCLK